MPQKDFSNVVQPERGLDAGQTGGSPYPSSLTREAGARDGAAALTSTLDFHRICDSLPELIWTCTPDGACEFLNERWLSYTGVPSGEQLGAGWLKRVHEEDRPHLMEAWTMAISQGTPFQVEYRLRRRDGEYLWFDVRAAPIRDASGQILRWFGSNTDIHEQREMREALLRRVEELTQSNAALEQFAYIASHDLREPLRGVAGCVQLLEKRYGDKLDDRAHEFIQHALGNVQRMQDLVNSLLEYARVDRLDRPFTIVDCNIALGETLTHLSAALEESGAVVSADPLPPVLGDRTQIGQLFQNLVSNAIKFRGEQTPRVHVSASRCPSEALTPLWRFTVRDNGIGIDPEHSERIFGMFQRLHSRGSYPGTGVGLAICKRVVERHGGRIWIESEPGKGCAFHFTLSGPVMSPYQPGGSHP